MRKGAKSTGQWGGNASPEAGTKIPAGGGQVIPSHPVFP